MGDSERKPLGFSVPDMSLPERASDNPPAPLAPLPPREQAIPDNKDAIVPRPIAPRPGDWKVGDFVLAPWDQQFLYTGHITEIQSGKVRIAFDDGDDGWALLGDLRPPVFEVGQRLYCRRQSTRVYVEATVMQVSSDQLRLRFAQDSREEWVSFKTVCVPCQPAGPSAPFMHAQSPAMFLDALQPGAHVWAPWAADNLFVGRVSEIRGQEAFIRFDDGDSGWVQVHQLHPFHIEVGMEVFARSGSGYSPGIVVSLDRDRIVVQFHGGKQQTVTSAALALPCFPAGPAARQSMSGRLRTWILPILFAVLFIGLRACSRRW